MIDFFQEPGEKTDGRSFSDHFRNSKLPSRKRDKAGDDEHAGNEMSYRFAKHHGVSQTERCSCTGKLGMGNNAADQSRRCGIAYSCKQCTCHNGDRHVLFRIFYSFGIGTRSFQTEKSPKNHCNGITHGDIKGSVGRIPGSLIGGKVEMTCTEDNQAGHGKADTEDAQRGESPEFFRSDQTDGCSCTKREDGSQANLNRR